MIQINVSIPTGEVILQGQLSIPENALGLVLFAHGSGSSRFSPRNQFVAETLREENIATLLMDLLTKEEEEIDLRTRHLRFDIGLLAKRLKYATEWAEREDSLKGLPFGYFGSSTGAAAALIAAAHHGERIKAVVSRGGRPDLAAKALSAVVSPTLFIIGGNDVAVIELNQEAFDMLSCEKKMEIIPGATHLFEEPGTLEQVSTVARAWFVQHFR